MWAYYFTKNKVSIIKVLSTELKKLLELFEFEENLSMQLLRSSIMFITILLRRISFKNFLQVM